MIRPNLRDLINNHKPTMESNNEEDDRAEWKNQLVIILLTDKNFEGTRTIYSASKTIEIFMGSDTENTVDKLVNTILERIQKAIKR